MKFRRQGLPMRVRRQGLPMRVRRHGLPMRVRRQGLLRRYSTLIFTLISTHHLPERSLKQILGVNGGPSVRILVIPVWIRPILQQ